MNQIWLIIIAVSIAALSGYLISLIIELKKTVQSVNEVLRSTEGSLKSALDEVQLTLKSLRSVSDDINEVTSDIKTVSGSVRDVGQNIQRVNTLVNEVTSLTAVRVSGLKAGMKAGLAVILSNLFSRKGE
jgi:uncharacterized protein YoxC